MLERVAQWEAPEALPEGALDRFGLVAHAQGDAVDRRATLDLFKEVLEERAPGDFRDRFRAVRYDRCEPGAQPAGEYQGFHRSAILAPRLVAGAGAGGKADNISRDEQGHESTRLTKVFKG